ncbi:hypothetical protein [Rhodoplanes sp. SY1]|uniref:hypothetical protein n=1 Tax=Rhodoplanes sp. SY1 TaxID=3166646 RepID=UPI0038B5FDC7
MSRCSDDLLAQGSWEENNPPDTEAFFPGDTDSDPKFIALEAALALLDADDIVRDDDETPDPEQPTAAVHLNPDNEAAAENAAGSASPVEGDAGPSNITVDAANDVCAPSPLVRMVREKRLRIERDAHEKRAENRAIKSAHKARKAAARHPAAARAAEIAKRKGLTGVAFEWEKERCRKRINQQDHRNRERNMRPPKAQIDIAVVVLTRAEISSRYLKLKAWLDQPGPVQRKLRGKDHEIIKDWCSFQAFTGEHGRAPGPTEFAALVQHRTGTPTTPFQGRNRLARLVSMEVKAGPWSVTSLAEQR